jgi:hypothetical protein
LLPPAEPGTALRILATTDLGAHTVPLRTSYGESGTIAGVIALLDRERERQPTIWLDVGDLVVGSPAYPLLGARPWADVADLPIAAAAAGNHEFDDGVAALLDAARGLSFPLLCANVDIGLPPTAMLDTPVGPVGVLGLTHPASHELSTAPAPPPDWPQRAAAHARELRAAGARWVVALLHDGVEWWPLGPVGGGPPVGTRSTRLDAVARPWAEHVDLVLGGHNFASWTGALAGTPAAEPHVFGTTLAVVDLGDRTLVRGIFRVPPVRPATSTRAIEAIDAAAGRVVAETEHAWLTRTGAQHYLPDLLAAGLRIATGADAGFVLPSYHGIQAPLDGAIGVLGPGPVSELDVLRMCADPEYDPVVVELRPGELRAAARAYRAAADPGNTATDHLAWNWCRMPAATSTDRADPGTVAVIPGVVAHLSEWLGREVESEPAGVPAREALVAALT